MSKNYKEIPWDEKKNADFEIRLWGRYNADCEYNSLKSIAVDIQKRGKEYFLIPAFYEESAFNKAGNPEGVKPERLNLRGIVALRQHFYEERSRESRFCFVDRGEYCRYKIVPGTHAEKNSVLEMMASEDREVFDNPADVDVTALPWSCLGDGSARVFPAEGVFVVAFKKKGGMSVLAAPTRFLPVGLDEYESYLVDPKDLHWMSAEEYSAFEEDVISRNCEADAFLEDAREYIQD